MINTTQDPKDWLKTSEPQPVDDPPAPAPQPDQGGDEDK